MKYEVRIYSQNSKKIGFYEQVTEFFSIQQLALFFRTLHDVFEAKKNGLKETIITEIKKFDTSDISRHSIFVTMANVTV